MNLETTYIADCLACLLFPERQPPIPPQGIDWDRLFTQLQEHRLAGYFFTQRIALGARWPEDFTRRLREVRAMLLLYGDQCAIQIKSVLEAFHQTGINTIVLKGWAAIPTLYDGDYSARFYEDIDLLVQPQDTTRAKDVLTNLGYQADAESWPGYADRFSRAQTFTLIKQPRIFDRIFAVGLHWSLIRRPYYDPILVDLAALFARSEPLEVLGIPARQLSAEDQVIYGCAHLGLHHKYDPALFRHFELAAAIQRRGAAFDWAGARDLAGQWHCIIPMKRILAALNNLWEGLIPASALGAAACLKPDFTERLVAWWSDKTHGNSALYTALTWITIPGIHRKLELAFKDTFPSPAYMQHRYGPAPRGFWPLLYWRRFSNAAGLLSKDGRSTRLSNDWIQHD